MTDILGVQNTIQTMDRIMPGFFPSQMVNPYHIFVSDFVHCFELQENSDPKFLCDALILAVNHGIYYVLRYSCILSFKLLIQDVLSFFH